MAGYLLATKTYLPAPQGEQVMRARLQARLDAAIRSHHRVVLVSASAGAGKSTLLAGWAAEQPLPAAWVSLDAGDNDPILFWMYLIAAVQTRYPAACQAVMDRLKSPQPPDLPAILPEIANELAALSPGGLLLVLDDLHTIENPSIHEGLAFLINHLPPRIHIVLSTRSDPPLPLHHWRARGQLTELRFDDLRFNLAEAAAFFNEQQGLSLRPDDIEQIERRTEGWAVGLQMAALSLRGRKDVSAFIAHFSASHHYILEYLTNEVLAQLPAAEQNFLMQTAILPRLCARLCDAVTGRDDSRAMLDQLLRANLFLIPLDDEHEWFRYHHLFADLLAQRLKAQGEAFIQSLHLRAAHWFDREALVDEAIHHALAAGAVEYAGEIVARSWRKVSFDGRVRATRVWLEAIPPEISAASPLLSVANAWTLLQAGHTEAAEAHAANALRLYQQWHAQGRIPADDFNYATIPGQMAALRALVAVRRWDIQLAYDQAQEALRLSKPDDHLPIGLATLALMFVHRETGHFEECIHFCSDAVRENAASGNIHSLANSVVNCGRALVVQGRLAEADEHYRAAFEEARRSGQDHQPTYALLRTAWAELKYEQNNLEAARDLLDVAVEMERQAGYIELTRSVGTLQARLRLAAGDAEGAVQALTATLQAVRRAGMPAPVVETAAWLARVQAQTGDLAAAARWAESVPVDRSAAHPGYTRCIEQLALARVWTALGRCEEACRLAADLEKFAAGSGSLFWQTEALLLQAVALLALERPIPARQAFERAVHLAAPEGGLRLFLDLGEPARRLIAEMRPAGPLESAFLRRLASNLLSHEPEAPALARRGPPAPLEVVEDLPGAPDLIESLSEREVEVLRLAARGLTNVEIAEKLVVAVSTIKTHLNHIYAKLGARNRTEALVRAKALKMM